MFGLHSDPICFGVSCSRLRLFILLYSLFIMYSNGTLSGEQELLELSKVF